MNAKFFTVGDDRPLRHLLSDPAIRIVDVKVVGKFTSAKDFELCVMYERDSTKTSRNRFGMFIDTPAHVVEDRLNRILSREGITNIHLHPFITQRVRGYAMFYEESTYEPGDEEGHEDDV